MLRSLLPNCEISTSNVRSELSGIGCRLLYSNRVPWIFAHAVAASVSFVMASWSGTNSGAVYPTRLSIFSMMVSRNCLLALSLKLVVLGILSSTVQSFIARTDKFIAALFRLKKSTSIFWLLKKGRRICPAPLCLFLSLL